ncbi:DUF1617 family protein [Enterococcus sp. AZ109]|uniref:DUF1617 family protein n=1 Tax=Enterococcus sp. AZ109 TaxID=2774634 RepID=UPI003F254D8C
MKITLKNIEINPAIEFLQSLTLKPADSRHRSKFVKQLAGAADALSASEKLLLEEFDALDENGVVKKEVNEDTILVAKISKEQLKLFNEQVTIESGMFTKNFEEIPRILNEYDGELSGADAEIYDRLLDEFENNSQEDVE